MRSPTLGRAGWFPTVLAAFALAASGCAIPTPGAPQTGPRPGVELDSGTRTTWVRVEIVDTPEARQRGLMGRTTLDEDAGMLFLWPEDSTSPFHMKDTPIPLSIAFISAEGRVVRILDMEPCTSDPCPTYDPQTSYRMALEVRHGSFARWGITVGAHVRVVR